MGYGPWSVGFWEAWFLESTVFGAYGLRITVCGRKVSGEHGFWNVFFIESSVHE